MSNQVQGVVSIHLSRQNRNTSLSKFSRKLTENSFDTTFLFGPRAILVLVFVASFIFKIMMTFFDHFFATKSHRRILLFSIHRAFWRTRAIEWGDNGFWIPFSASATAFESLCQLITFTDLSGSNLNYGAFHTSLCQLITFTEIPKRKSVSRPPRIAGKWPEAFCVLRLKFAVVWPSDRLNKICGV